MSRTVLSERNIVSLIPTTLRMLGLIRYENENELGDLFKIIELINLYKNKIISNNIINLVLFLCNPLLTCEKN